MSIATPPYSQTIALPSLGTLTKLFAGGLAGLAVWEFWGRIIAPLVIGGPLEPQGLVMALSGSLLGIGLSKTVATGIHFAIGIAAYPIAYWIISRLLPRWGAIFDVGVWAIFTAYLVSILLAGKATGTILLLWVMVTFVSASRFFNPSATAKDAISWGNFAWFNALGIMAPIAGMPFLLIGAADKLSLMSWAGHVVYGAIAVIVFEWLNRGKR